jgi:hypothetical protein
MAYVVPIRPSVLRSYKLMLPWCLPRDLIQSVLHSGERFKNDGTPCFHVTVQPADLRGVPGSMWIYLQLQFIYDRQPVGQPVLVSGVHLGPTAIFYCLL